MLCLITAPASAQTRISELATLFQNLFGPTGLTVNSEDVLPDGSTHSAHFNSAFQSNFTQLNIALAGQLASLPLPSPASGFTYTFDSSTGTFVRSTQSFGPILADRAETIGRGKLSVGYNFQYFSFDSLEGFDLRQVPAVFRHDNIELGGGRLDVVTTVNSIEASVVQLTGTLTYGVTDRLDLSLAVPIVRTRLHVLSDATVQRLGTAESLAVHFFRDPDAPGGLGSRRQFFAEGTAAGLGDVIVRVKHTVMREGQRGLAVGADLRVPTGDELDLLGSGALGVRPFAALSTSYGRVSPHVNVAYQWNGSSVLAGDVSTRRKEDFPDRFLYIVGADMGVTDNLTLVVEFIGQRAIDSPRLAHSAVTVVTPTGSATFPDIRFEETSSTILNGAVGMKTRIGGQLLANFNLLFKLNDRGLVDRIAPLIGVEYGF